MMKKFFDCDKCGLCCQNLKRSSVYIDFDRGDGVCKNFDETTKLCKIYYERPIICNIDAYYEKFLKKFMTREDFHKLNHAVCIELKEEEVVSDD